MDASARRSTAVVLALVMAAILAGRPTAAQEAQPACQLALSKAASAHKVLFFANDFGYLETGCEGPGEPRDAFTRLGDSFKRLELSGTAKLDLGGEFRARYHHENGIGRSRLDGLHNDFLLTRLRLYANLELGKSVRVFVEGIDARQTGSDFPPRGIEVDHADLLNAFIDLKLSRGDHKLTFRAGRQELLFGSQRLISPLNWANTRRVFDGFRLDHQYGEWGHRLIAVRPRLTEPRSFNGTDDSQSLIGAYSSFAGLAGNVIDLYYLRRKETSGAGFVFHTLGGRLKGNRGDLLYEAEAAYQFGHRGALDHDAGMVTAGLGYRFSSVPWKPVFWLFYDWASGDGDPDDAESGTFNQLFPLGHAYFGFMDIVARQNISAISLRLTAKPAAKLTLHAALHSFYLAKKADGLYNAGGRLIRSDASAGSGAHIGEEIDITATLALLQRIKLQLGYSHFFGGRFVERTNPPGIGGNADFFYSHLVLQF